ncbi:hypothetical protein OIO90_002586 [Microbotryomycetes sp. JL221]|nr:hypothetical protein OIO90_002586 [Microbotryomycetes sp. JL221]
MHVLVSSLCTRHDPPYEILSGQLKPYFESPERLHKILNALLQLDQQEDSTTTTTTTTTTTATAPSESTTTSTTYTPLYTVIDFDDWTEQDVLTDRVLAKHVKQVHQIDYLDYIRLVYDQWCSEGGNPEAVLPETFLRTDLLLEADAGPRSNASSIEKAGRYSFDLSCPITRDTWLASLASARLCIEATKLLLSSTEQTGITSTFALCRPPGHHANAGLAGGYCYINNVAVAVKYYIDTASRSTSSQLGPTTRLRVAILDIDAHHGNGTSKIFYDDAETLYVSLHASPEYPYYTGSTAERGGPQALDSNINFPLPLKTDNLLYISTLSTAIGQIKRFKPQILFLSLGVDTYIEDPLTDMNLTLEVYPEIGRMIAQVNVSTCFVLEGGYCMEQIGNCVKGVLDGFQQARFDTSVAG